MEKIQSIYTAFQNLVDDCRSYLLVLGMLCITSFGQLSISDLKSELKSTPNENVERRINLLNDITWEYIYISTDTALYYGLQSLNLAESHRDQFPKALSNTYGTIAIIYDIQGNNDKALELYLESLTLKEMLKDSAGIANTKSNIGALFFTQNDFLKAKPYFIEALEFDVAIRDTLNQIGSLINLSIIHKNLNETGKAKQYLHHALFLNKLVKNKYYESNIYNNLGAQYLALDEIDSARFYFEKSEKLHSDGDNLQNYCIGLENLAKIYLRLGQIEKAKTKGMLALKIATEEKYYQVLTNTYETLYEIYLYENATDSAFYFKSQYELLRDSILKKDNKLIVDEIEAKYELQKKQNEILHKDLEIEEERQFSQAYLLISIAILMVAIILGFLIRLKIRSNNQLAEKNVIIEASLAEKEVLMREIHHRVKNNIQAIKSIINIQKRKQSSKEAKDSLNETLNRVNAMAIIHDRLYKQKNISDITSDLYLTELLFDILGSFGVDHDEHVVELDFCSFELPTDDLLTLGLVFNEAVTNSCKYGKSADGLLYLSVSSHIENGIFLLEIKDQGPGLKTDKTGFGTNLINALIHKLNGKISYFSEHGLTVRIEIPINE